MSILRLNDEAFEIQEAAAEEVLLQLEEEVQQMAENILECRTSLPDQLSSTISSLLASQRPVLQTRLANEGPDPEVMDFDSGVSQVTEAEKIRLLNQKISSNASLLPIVLKRMEEYMARIDSLASPIGIIHPAFKRK